MQHRAHFVTLLSSTLVSLAATLAVAPLQADTLDTYNVSASLPASIYAYDSTTPIAPSTLTGTLVVDQTAGTVLNGSLTLTGGISGTYTVAFSGVDYFYPSLTDVFASDPSANPGSTTPANAFPILDLIVSTSDLSSGGNVALITTSNFGTYENGLNSAIFLQSNVGQGEGQNISFTSGTVSLPPNPSPVPEPGSLALMGTGLIAAAATLHRFQR